MAISRVRRIALGAAVAAIAMSGSIASVGPVFAASVRPAVAPTILASYIEDVSVAPGSTVAYAIGYQRTSTTPTPFIMRFNGSHGRRVAVHYPAGYGLSAIVAATPTSVWAVGSLLNSATATYRPVILHSTGGAFKPVKNKLPAGALNAVSASSPTNVWAVGQQVAHWNGHHWKSVKFPKKHASYVSASVSTSSPTNVWMMDADGHNLAAHWNGHKYSFTKIPGPAMSTYSAIATTSAKNAWAVGTTNVPIVNQPVGKSKPLTGHWNGRKWAYVKSPNPGKNTVPGAVAALGSHAYLAGTTNKTSLKTRPAALGYSGGKWHPVKVAKVGETAFLLAVSESSKETVIAGASCQANLCQPELSGTPKALIEVLKGKSFHRIATPKLRQ